MQDARKALEMFHQVKVEVIGLVENMSQMTLPSGEVIDVFGAGGTERRPVGSSDEQSGNKRTKARSTANRHGSDVG